MIIGCPLVIDGQQIAGKALEMIAVLMEKLHASVALQDVQRREAHIKMTDMWHCEATAPDEVPIGMRDPDVEQLSAPINGAGGYGPRRTPTFPPTRSTWS